MHGLHYCCLFSVYNYIYFCVNNKVKAPPPSFPTSQSLHIQIVEYSRNTIQWQSVTNRGHCYMRNCSYAKKNRCRLRLRLSQISLISSAFSLSSGLNWSRPSFLTNLRSRQMSRQNPVIVTMCMQTCRPKMATMACTFRSSVWSQAGFLMRPATKLVTLYRC